MIVALDDLEVKCCDCKGSGVIREDDRPTPCLKCSGKGYVLTGLGQTLLDFVKTSE